MLVLARRVDEAIVLQVPGREPITVRLIRIGPESVRLGFSADLGVKILREELLGPPGCESTDPLIHSSTNQPTGGDPCSC